MHNRNGAEQSLANYETCCLAEVFLPNNKTKEELWDIVELLYKINKHSLALPCHLKETEHIVHKNMRMGIGVTGYLQSTPEQRLWLKDTYVKLRELDKKYSAEHGFNESIKLTTVKPSGTLSLLAGVTSGVHPGYSRYYIRRVRVSTSSHLLPAIKEGGYPMEPAKTIQLKVEEIDIEKLKILVKDKFDEGGLEAVKDMDISIQKVISPTRVVIQTPVEVDDPMTNVVSFPCESPEDAVLEKDVTAIQQLEYVKELQTNWSDNSVSCTVYYKKEELPEIREWLRENFANSVKSVSFLLHSEHGFSQPPLEEITEEVYNDMKSKITEVDWNLTQHDVEESLECGSGGCPII
jgi:hypothetical protein